MAVLEPPTETRLLDENNLTTSWWDWFVNTSTSTNANDIHRDSDGKDHSDVVLNNTHRTSDGSDHTFIDQDIKTTSSPSFSSFFISSIKSGATQAAAGAAVNEQWKTASHATLPDNVLMIGV